MKTMTCRQLGGACDTVFRANSFEEISEMSKNHGIDMFQKGDPAHLEAMEKMKELMKKPEEMQGWLDRKKLEFESLPDES